MPTLVPRSAPRWLTDPFVNALASIGVTPNMLTVLGVLGNAGAGVLAWQGEFLAAGVVVLLASALDMFDGALARATGKATSFGSVFDATMDRVSEAAVLFGLLAYFTGQDGHRTEELLIFAAIVGSIMVSYVRARAEIVGLKMKEGLFTRLERVVILGGGLILESVTSAILPMLWILAVMAWATAAQRLALVWLKTRGSDDTA